LGMGDYYFYGERKKRLVSKKYGKTKGKEIKKSILGERRELGKGNLSGGSGEGGEEERPYLIYRAKSYRSVLKRQKFSSPGRRKRTKASGKKVLKNKWWQFRRIRAAEL